MLGVALIDLRRFEEAVAAATKAVRKNKTFGLANRCLAAALAHLGRDAEAKRMVAQILELEPGFRISDLLSRSGKWPQSYFEGLRKAGLPE